MIEEMTHILIELKENQPFPSMPAIATWHKCVSTAE